MTTALQTATTGDQGRIAIDRKALRAAMKRSTAKSNLTFVLALATDGDDTLALKDNRGTTFQAVNDTLTDPALDSLTPPS